MPNTIELKSISSVCTTAKELITSEDFLRWIEIILKKVKYFDKDYICWLFIKLQNSEDLNKDEKESLEIFMLDSKVSELWQELLSRLKNVSIKPEIKNIEELSSFLKLLEEIFSEDWFKKVQAYVWEVANITELTLNKYEWMKKVSIKINWERKNIYMDELNLKVDSDKWEEKEIDWKRVKINPERDIIEYLDWKLTWEQLFTWRAVMRESKKKWKRLPDDKEFQAIIDEVWVEEFNKLSPGYHAGGRFYNYDTVLNFWTASKSGSTHNIVYLMEGYADFVDQEVQKDSMFSVCCIND